MNTVTVALQGKGIAGLLQRVRTIGGRYGLTPLKMQAALTHFAKIMASFQSGATFPVTGLTFARNNGVLNAFQGTHIEIAVHGLAHRDHTRVPYEKQLAALHRARRLFTRHGTASNGFRSPYLRWNEDTLQAVLQAGFTYDSSQAVYWDVGPEMDTDRYRRALSFYRAIPADAYPVLPRLEQGLIRIPYCLPDDEAFIERFKFRSAAPMSEIWLSILEKTHQLGELFSLGLHPERIYLCEEALISVLERATQMPDVWVTRMDELACWWKDRTESTVSLTQNEKGDYVLRASGPDGLVFLARNTELLTPSSRWDDHYDLVRETDVRLRASCRPVVGVSARSDRRLTSFLTQQGYIVEQTDQPHAYAFYLDRPTFTQEDERPLLKQIEQDNFPLVRLGRWPNGARSAFCVSGDIDSLTLWDYGLRFLGL